jgi:putative ABC transport system permease protein
MRLTRWIEECRDDVTFALRQLRRAPGFTFVAAATLALGIGANSAIFALVDATLLRPLPLPNPDRLVMAWEQSPTSPRGRVAPLNMLDWNERSRTFARFGGCANNVGGMVMAGADGTAQTVDRQWVTSGFFDALGVRPVAGRTFIPDDDVKRLSGVVMTESFWRSRFNGDPSVVGRDLLLDGELYTVIGVVPDAAQILARTSIWALLPIPERNPNLRTAYALRVVGRMKPGVSLEQARSDLAAVADGLAREFPKTNTGRSVAIEPLHGALVGSELRTTSMLFLGVVGIVLLICCANVANLLLARATVRTRELAIRSALGAGRRRVIRQLLTESLVLSIIGGALGAGVGALILEAAPAMIPEGLLPGAITLGFDARVVAFCATAALVVGVLFGLAPAWQATELSSSLALTSDSRTTTGRGGTLRGLLVGAEVATAVLLLFGAGLLLRTLLNLESVDRGYRAESVLTMIVDPLGEKYPTTEALMQFFGDIEREVKTVPGVVSVGWASTLPMGPSMDGNWFTEIVGEASADERDRPVADKQIVSPGYFQTLDLPVVAGRAFTGADREGSVPVCIVNEAFVNRLLGGRAPVGQRVSMRRVGAPGREPVVREIVGVARQVKARPDEADEMLQVYVPLAQDAQDDIFLVVRPESGDAALLANGVRAAIARVDKEQLVSVRGLMTLDDIAREATSRHRFRAVLVVTFAGLALLLATIGVFGILAYSVQQRVRDFAVRRALGASSRDVLRLVLGSAGRVVGAGALVGLAMSAAAARTLERLLFGVAPLDPLTIVAVVATLIVTAGVAVVAPAWRATRIDPATALRTE